MLTDEQNQRLIALTGEKTRVAMELRDLDVAGLVHRSGLGRSTVYDLIGGAGSPQLLTLVRLAEALDVSPRMLMPTLDEVRNV